MSIKRKPTDAGTPVMLLENLAADDWVTVWADSTKTGHRMQVSTLRAWLASQPLMSPAPVTGRVLVADGAGGLADGGVLLEDLGGGGGGATTLRFITESTPVGYEGVLYATVDADINNAVLIPFSESQGALALPDIAAPVGSQLTVLYGSPADGLDPPSGTPADVALGILLDEYAPHISLAIDPQAGFVTLAYGERITLVKTDEVAVSPEQTYHLWTAVSDIRAGSAGGGGGGHTVRWDPNTYDNAELSRYQTFSDAVAALQAVGGGALEVLDWGGTVYDEGQLDMTNIDLVGQPSGFFAQLEFGGTTQLLNLRSARNITFAQASPTVSSMVFDANRRFVVENCNLGDGYTATEPFIDGVRYLELRGGSRLGPGALSSGGGIDVHAFDGSVLFEGAVAASTFLNVYLYDSAAAHPTQAASSSYWRYPMATDRLRPVTLAAGSSALPVAANAFFEADTDAAGGNITVTPTSPTGLLGFDEGARAYVAKRGTGGNVIINSLAYVPGGGTSYTITEENAVVELVWLPGGVQVRP